MLMENMLTSFSFFKEYQLHYYHHHQNVTISLDHRLLLLGVFTLPLNQKTQTRLPIDHCQLHVAVEHDVYHCLRGMGVVPGRTMFPTKQKVLSLCIRIFE